MAFFNGWPWANFQEQNLDWIIKKIKNLFDKDSELESGISDNSDKISNLQAQVNDINSRLPAVIPDYNLKRYICIGDSIAQGYFPGGNVTGWPALLKAAVGAADTDFYINYMGGAGFYGATSGKNFYDLLSELENTVTEPNTISHIIVAGGVNDINKTPAPTESAYRGKIHEFCDYAAAQYPNAVIHFYWLGKDKGLQYYYTQVALLHYLTTTRRKNFVVHTETAAAISNLANFASDGIHLNQQAEYNIVSTMLTGHFEDSAQIIAQVNDEVLTNASFPPLFTQIQDDITSVYIGAGILNLANPDTDNFICDGSHVYKLAHMLSGYWLGNNLGNSGRSSTHIIAAADILIRYTETAPNRYHLGKGILFAYQGDIYICPFCQDTVNNGFVQRAYGIYWSNMAASFYSVA